MNPKALYWKAFLVYFCAVISPCLTIFLPIFVWDAAVHHGPRTALEILGFATKYLAVFFALSWACAWMIVALADSKDENVRAEQLRQLFLSGRNSLIWTGPVGWAYAVIVLLFWRRVLLPIGWLIGYTIRAMSR